MSCVPVYSWILSAIEVDMHACTYVHVVSSLYNFTQLKPCSMHDNTNAFNLQLRACIQVVQLIDTVEPLYI